MLKPIILSCVEIALYAATGFAAAFLLATLAVLIGAPSEQGAINYARFRLGEVGPMGFYTGLGIGCLLVLKRQRRCFNWQHHRYSDVKTVGPH